MVSYGVIRQLIQMVRSDIQKRLDQKDSHSLQPIINGQPFGIAEGYATAATCMENTGITCICCFSSNNIKDVSISLSEKYPDSSIIIFAYNDRHLDFNKGVLKAQEAQKSLDGRVVLAVPFFVDLETSKEASDWNDLVRLKGRDEASAQLVCLLKNLHLAVMSK